MWQYPKVINIIMPKNNRCSSTPKYPSVETIRERILGRLRRKLGYKFGGPPRQNNIQERENKFCASGPPSDRQKRGQEGGKAQENTRKKGMKAVNSELIRHFACASPAIKKWVNRLQHIFSKQMDCKFGTQASIKLAN